MALRSGDELIIVLLLGGSERDLGCNAIWKLVDRKKELNKQVHS
jgi:hypothetical protein